MHVTFLGLRSKKITEGIPLIYASECSESWKAVVVERGVWRDDSKRHAVSHMVTPRGAAGCLADVKCDLDIALACQRHTGA